MLDLVSRHLAQLLLVLGGILVIIGGVLTYLKEEEQTKQQNKHNKEIIDLQEENNKYSSKISLISTKNNELLNQNDSLARKNSELNNRIFELSSKVLGVTERVERNLDYEFSYITLYFEIEKTAYIDELNTHAFNMQDVVKGFVNMYRYQVNNENMYVLTEEPFDLLVYSEFVTTSKNSFSYDPFGWHNSNLPVSFYVKGKLKRSDGNNYQHFRSMSKENISLWLIRNPANLFELNNDFNYDSINLKTAALYYRNGTELNYEINERRPITLDYIQGYVYDLILME